jgi:pyruvate dehydrogenase E1 component
LCYVERQLTSADGPVIAASDYIRGFAEQIRAYIPRSYRTLGTDGWGRSDGREKLRQFFEVDRNFVCVAALSSLVEEGSIEPETVSRAIQKYGIDVDEPAPRLR